MRSKYPDTPFSIGGYDAALLKDTQATDFTDVLKPEPSATVQATSFNEGTEFALREAAPESVALRRASRTGSSVPRGGR